MSDEKTQYIGDGVYLSNDGYQLILQAGENVVYLDVDVFLKLKDLGDSFYGITTKDLII